MCMFGPLFRVNMYAMLEVVIVYVYFDDWRFFVASVLCSLT